MPVARRIEQDGPLSDRRGALRHPVEVDSIVATATTVHRSVTVIDISEHGCQVQRPAELENGTHLSLSFGGFAPIDATVVWTSPTAAGLRFEQAIHPALVASVVAAGKGRRRTRPVLPGALVRRADRQPSRDGSAVRFEIDAGTSTWNRDFNGELADISSDGCRINTGVALLIGTAVRLQISGAPVVTGTVRWCKGNALGIAFSTPMPGDLVDAVLRGSTISS